MVKNSFFLGSYVSFRKPHYLAHAVEQTVTYGGKSMMFFLGSPQSFHLFETKELDKEAFYQSLQKHNLQLDNVVIHASYLINLANISNPRVRETAIKLLTNTVENASYLGIRHIVLHPGSALKNDRNQSMLAIAHGLDIVLADFPAVNICLETMSGKGSELGKTFDELQFIIAQTKHKSQIKICWDLCHLFAAGYDIVNHFPQVLAEFDTKIGRDKLALVHVNDSLKPFQSNQDRHANIGQGLIGLQPIARVLASPAFANLPLILETPYIDGQPPYREEIRQLTDLCRPLIDGN